MVRRVLVTVDLRFSHFRRILAGARQRAWELGDVRVTAANARAVIDLVHQSWDGIIVLESEELGLERLKEQSCRIVNISNRAESGILPRVVSDDLEVGRMAARHLAELGYRRLMFVHMDDLHHTRLRMEGFLQEAQRLGRQADTTLLQKDRSMGSFIGTGPSQLRFRQRIDEFLSSQNEVVGCFSGEDTLACAIWLQAQTKQVPIPERLGLIGVGNEVAYGDLSGCSLSSVDLDSEGIGQRALDAVLGPTDPARIQLVRPKDLIVRETTGLSVLEDPIVQMAMSKINQRPFTVWTAESLANSLNIHRKTLYNHFVEALGKPVRRVLLDARMTEAKRLLRGTSLHVREIGHRVGYAEEAAFSTAFRKQHGLPPNAWRIQQAVNQTDLY